MGVTSPRVARREIISDNLKATLQHCKTRKVCEGLNSNPMAYYQGPQDYLEDIYDDDPVYAGIARDVAKTQFNVNELSAIEHYGKYHIMSIFINAFSDV